MHILVAGTVELIDVDDPAAVAFCFLARDRFHVGGKHIQCLVHHVVVFLLYGVGDVTLAAVPNDVAGEEPAGHRGEGDQQT